MSSEEIRNIEFDFLKKLKAGKIEAENAGKFYIFKYRRRGVLMDVEIVKKRIAGSADIALNRAKYQLTHRILNHTQEAREEAAA